MDTQTTQTTQGAETLTPPKVKVGNKGYLFYTHDPDTAARMNQSLGYIAATSWPERKLKPDYKYLFIPAMGQDTAAYLAEARGTVRRLHNAGLEAYMYGIPKEYDTLAELMGDGMGGAYLEWTTGDISGNMARFNADQLQNCRGSKVFERTDDIIMAGTYNNPVDTGIGSLDKMLHGGFVPGLVIMGGESSVGKTTGMLHIADHIARKGQRRVLIISCEMGAHELISKMISRNTAVLADNLNVEEDIRKSPAITSLAYLKTEWGAEGTPRYDIVNMARREFYEYGDRIYIYEPDGRPTLSEIRAQAEALAEISRVHNASMTVRAAGEVEEMPPVIFIDYLQMLGSDDESLRDEQTIITDNMLKLRQLSRDLKCVVFVLSSTKRQAEGQAAGMADMKGSGSIEFSCDYLLKLQVEGTQGGADRAELAAEKSKAKRGIEILILKNRSGAIDQSAGILIDYWTPFGLWVERQGANDMEAWRERMLANAKRRAEGIEQRHTDRLERQDRNMAERERHNKEMERIRLENLKLRQEEAIERRARREQVEKLRAQEAQDIQSDTAAESAEETPF